MLMQPDKQSAAARRKAAPRLGVQWERRQDSLRSSILALLHGPAPPQGWPLGPFFRESWVRFYFPSYALVFSILLHVAFVFVPFPGWGSAASEPEIQKERYQLTWSGPVRDLPPFTPSVKSRTPAPLPSPPGDPARPMPPRGADAVHPRQLILSQPARPNHPRQTLIQPDSPPDPPKVLPPLPNIVQWKATAAPARPKLELRESRVRVRQAMRKQDEVQAPDIRNQETAPGPLNIASSPVVVPKPALALAPSAVPLIGPRNISGDAGPAPDATPAAGGGEAALRSLIALSANPSPPAPQVEVPEGNLSARLAISPEGTQPGVPGGSANGVPGSTGGSGGAPGSPGGAGTGNGGSGGGPPGITIVGGDPKNRGTVSGGGSGSGIIVNRPTNPLKLPPRSITPTAPAADVGRSRPAPALDAYRPGAPPEIILGPKRIYTLSVSMPNVNSATGSWEMKFAELDEAAARKRAAGEEPVLGPLALDLVGPVPLRKVDPKYPPVLVSARVQGDVILYAIIRKDGTVDSIQLIRGLEPRLDQNSISALSQWRFQPAERHGVPVDLEAVVRIPFRALAPL